jgi:hypothetical protein
MGRTDFTEPQCLYKGCTLHVTLHTQYTAVSATRGQYNVSVFDYFNLQEPCVLYIGRAYRYPPHVVFYIFFSTTISTEYFKHVAHSPFFSSKCHLFHNATFIGSCIIHILHIESAKI